MGTPLYNTFNGFVDFQGTPSPAIQVTGSAGGSVTYTFNNLDPNKRYSFKGGAVRGGADSGTTFYSTRWTLFELTGAAAFTSAHTANALTTTQVPALTAGQVAINTGINNTPTTGDMADWENIDPGPDGSFAVTSTQYAGTVPGGASDGPYCYALSGFRLEEINSLQTAAAITNQPQSQIVGELQPATFNVGVSGNPRPTVQWYKNNNPVQDATNLTYRIASAPLSDSGAAFTVVASNVASNLSTSVTSSVVTLTVNADTNAPILVRAVTLSGNLVQVTFSEPVNSASATNVTNYTITASNGNLSLSNATLQAGQTNVIIMTSMQLPGTLYTLRASNIRDISTAANTIATNSQATFTTAAGYIPNDIGAPGTAGSATPVVNGYDVVGSGNDIGGSSDQFMFAALQRSGDFDVKVRVESLSLTDPWAKAGLMARQNLTTNSQYAAVFATPTLSGCFYNWRATSGGGGTNNAGSFPVNYPYTWLRLQRTNNNTYVGYASLDGITWVLLGSSTVTMTDPIYFGYAVTSRSNAIPATARFRDTENIIGPSIVKPFSSRIEPLGPSSRKTGLVITEIMYKPAPRNDARNLEFIEIYNSNPYYEDISHYRIAGDIDYTFPAGTILQGGAFLVIAKVPADVPT